MKLCVSCQPNNSYDRYMILRAIKAAGFDGVFLSSQEIDLTDEYVNYVKELGLIIDTVHLPYDKNGKLCRSLINDFDVDQTVEVYKKEIDFVAKHGIKRVVFHSSTNHTPDEMPIKGLENIKRVVDYCKEKNVDICFENIFKVNYLESVLEYFKDYDNVKSCFDIGHANAFTKNLETYDWTNIFKRVGCVHLHDNDGEADQHLIPGLGNIDFMKYLTQIIKYNKDIYLTLELYFRNSDNYSEPAIYDFYKKAYELISEFNQKLMDVK